MPTESELFWMLSDGYQHVQICEAEATGGFGGAYCETFGVDDLEWMIWDADELAATIERLDIAPTDRIEVCYPNEDWRTSIQRSLVIDDTIWTMSLQGLQRNAADTLVVTASLPF